MRLVLALRVAGVAAMVGGAAVQATLRPGMGAGPVVLLMQVLGLVVPGLTVLGLAEARRFQVEARDMLAAAGPGQPSFAGSPPAPGHPVGRLWLVWLLRGLAGLLLAGMISEIATNVSLGLTLMAVVLTASWSLGLAAQAGGVAEILRVQAALRDALRARPQAD